MVKCTHVMIQKATAHQFNGHDRSKWKARFGFVGSELAALRVSARPLAASLLNTGICCEWLRMNVSRKANFVVEMFCIFLSLSCPFVFETKQRKRFALSLNNSLPFVFCLVSEHAVFAHRVSPTKCPLQI